VVGEGFEEFATAAWPGLLRYGHLLTGDRASAEDLVQTALLRTALRWGSIRSDDPTAYVKTAMARLQVNRATRLLRRERVVDVVPERPAAGDAVAQVDERSAMWQALATLPRRQRAVLVLRYYEQLSEREIAEVLGVSPGTVKSTASKALASLRSRVDVPDGVR
jgi:RNA polymerase sigma-70 factor (sigma-E family)